MVNMKLWYLVLLGSVLAYIVLAPMPAWAAQPKIQAISPQTWSVGEKVVITGIGFGTDPGRHARCTNTHNVSMNGVRLPNANILSWSNKKIAVKVPSWAKSGTVAVRVGNRKSKYVAFTITSTVATGSVQVTIAPVATSAPPAEAMTFGIRDISPDTAAVNAAVTINGIGFGNDPGAGARSTASNKVVFGGVQVPEESVLAWSDTAITVKVPPATIGTYVVVVAGSRQTYGKAFQIIAAAPVVTGVASAAGRIGDTMTVTDITGANFSTGAEVKLLRLGQSPIYATQVTVKDSTTIASATFDLSQAQDAGAWDVAVKNPDGREGYGFGYVSVSPFIASITPDPTQAGDTVVIKGIGFGADPGSGRRENAGCRVTLNGVAVQDPLIRGWYINSIILRLPPGAAGPVVVTANGVSSNSVAFTVDGTAGEGAGTVFVESASGSGR